GKISTLTTILVGLGGRRLFIAVIQANRIWPAGGGAAGEALATDVCTVARPVQAGRPAQQVSGVDPAGVAAGRVSGIEGGQRRGLSPGPGPTRHPRGRYYPT